MRVALCCVFCGMTCISLIGVADEKETEEVPEGRVSGTSTDRGTGGGSLVPR